MRLLEYIESTGSQYIDTGIKASDITKIEAKYMLTAIPGAWGCLFGSQGEFMSGALSCLLTWNNNRFGFRYGGGSNQVNGINSTSLNTVYEIMCDDGVNYYIDEVLQGSTSKGAVSNTLNVFLFANNTGSMKQSVSARIYYFKIYGADGLLLDLVPILDGGGACLYDNISGTYFHNRGAGSFISGPEIIESYTISYNSNGGSGVMGNQEVPVDELTPLSRNIFTRRGYVFIGWSTTPTGPVEYTDGEQVYNLAGPDESITLFAVWEKEQLVINFYYNQSDERQIYKNLINGRTYNGVLREGCSIVNPVIMFENEDVMRFNFCYIPEFQRYYFVREIETFRNNLWIVHMECDVLMSFKNDIANCQVVVDKQTMFENGDEYIDDGSLVADNYMFNTVYNFTGNGFNENPTFILITAG